MTLEIYYFVGILVLISLFKIVFNLNKFFFVIDWSLKFQPITKKKLSKERFRNLKDYNRFISNKFFILFEIIWLFVGIFIINKYIVSILIPLILCKRFILIKIKSFLLRKLVFTLLLVIRILIYLFLIVNGIVLH